MEKVILKMLQVKIKEPRKIEFEEVDMPVLKEGEAIIKIFATGICGSDMHGYLGRDPHLPPPRVQGHEFAGIISDIKGGHDLKIGDKVTVNPLINCGHCYYCKNNIIQLCENANVIGGNNEGSMKEFVSVPIKNIIKLPDSFDLIYGPFIEPTAIAVHAADRMKDSNILIIGSGNMGLIFTQLCRLNNNMVIVTYRREEISELAKKLGADLTININVMESAIDELKGRLKGDKIDIVIDCVAVKETIDFAVDAVKHGGEIMIVGEPLEDHRTRLLDLMLREIVLTQTYLYQPDEFRKAADLITKGKIKVDDLISKVFPFKEADKAYEYKANSKAIKVLVKNG